MQNMSNNNGISAVSYIYETAEIPLMLLKRVLHSQCIAYHWNNFNNRHFTRTRI